MSDKTATLSEILETGGFAGTAPSVCIVDPVYGEAMSAFAASTARRLGMFLFEAFEREDPWNAEISFADIVEDPDAFREMGHYRTYILNSPDDSVHSAIPVKEAAVQNDGRLLLFI